MERIKNIKDQLISQVQSQMNDLKKVNAKELGEVIDMIKDLSETMYYCEVYKQMEDSGKEMRNNYYYTERHYQPEYYYRDMDRQDGKMYYQETDYPITLHDEREGKSPVKRKMYMESKATHQNNNKIIKDLENYMNELTSDMTEMLNKATPEEKAIVQRKLDTLSNKVQNV